MVTKFRIAYPYASSDPQRTREAVVIPKPSPYPGFSTVYVRGRSCSLVRTDRGLDILRGLETGLQGQLIEPDPDPRRSSVHRGKIIGQGLSMELALVLSAFGSYESEHSFE